MVMRPLCACGCGERVRGRKARYRREHLPYTRIGLPAEQRFWEKVVKSDGCWLWHGWKDPQGYGRMRRGGSATGIVHAHRLSYQIHKGPIPPGMVVCHHCDNPSCVNPDHLFVGSQADNVDDMKRKGRSYMGERHWRSKLTEETVRIARYLYENERMSFRKLARFFSVSRDTIQQAIRRNSWTHVP